MDPIRKIPKKVTKEFVNKVINRQYFHRKTGLDFVVSALAAPMVKMSLSIYYSQLNLMTVDVKLCYLK